ncbi:hypothetical protein BpHYR1_018417 [Brachionus plicatilis]|uniref:Uncharacterized protein n=1 Tax=Brachionus plicatilis TaxID=10195 RepID=A0A3M7QZ48_BRAPC|nr:hypothetical protein BpHYR1_018417 [Brachionus plicatilis]
MNNRFLNFQFLSIFYYNWVMSNTYTHQDCEKTTPGVTKIFIKGKLYFKIFEKGFPKFKSNPSQRLLI